MYCCADTLHPPRKLHPSVASYRDTCSIMKIIFLRYLRLSFTLMIDILRVVPLGEVLRKGVTKPIRN
jgi:hypothetical protein